jgi:hypothetical protein
MECFEYLNGDIKVKIFKYALESTAYGNNVL